MVVGAGFMMVICVLGSVREVIGQGTLFANLHLLTGAGDMTIHFADSGLLIAALPPGAFILFGCLLALKNLLDQRAGRTAEPLTDPANNI